MEKSIFNNYSLVRGVVLGVRVSALRVDVFSIRIWPLRRDDSSRVLIGAGGMWRSDWLERV